MSCAGTTRQRTLRVRGDAGDQRVDRADHEVDQTAPYAGGDQLGQLRVQRAAEQRPDPTAARRQGDRLGRVVRNLRAEALHGDGPCDVDLRAGPQAGGDGQRDLVHGSSLGGAVSSVRRPERVGRV